MNLTGILYGLATLALAFLVYTYLVAFIAEKKTSKKITIFAFLLLFTSFLYTCLAVTLYQLYAIDLWCREVRGALAAVSATLLICTSLKEYDK